MNVYIAEIVGTALLILLGNGVVAGAVLSRSKAHAGGWIAITVGWGLAVAFAVYAVGRVSGAHINPAVTVSLASIGAFEWSLVPGYIASQVTGAFIGSVLVFLSYYAHWSHTENADLKLACHSTSPAVRQFGPAFMTEAIGTAVLIFGVLVIGGIAMDAPADVSAWSHVVGSYFGPLLVGLLVIAIGLSLGGPTGYAINPARDLGPRIAHSILPIPGKRDSDWRYAWVPIVAPIVGGFVAAQLYTFLSL